LGTKTREEYRVVSEGVSRDLPLCGFYAYGEIAPIGKGLSPRFHNETFITLMIGEE
jgi:hypothetical protein